MKLAERREPYWTVISAGCAVGYRKGAKGGTWVARLRDGGRQHYDALGAADDHRDPDGLTVFSFAQAQERARDFFTRKARELAGHAEPSEGPYTVAAAISDYLAARERRGSKGVRADRYAANARILPELGAVEVTKLTAKRIRDWHHTVAEAPKLLRTGKGAAKQATVPVDERDSEAVRARRSTANRLLTVLKAALNHAFHEGRAATDEPWRKVKPYREADAAVVRYLSPAECLRLVSACEPSFRHLVRGALVTGCRYGELIRLQAADFNPDAGTVTIRQSKAGKPRHVALNAEGQQLFAGLVAGKAARDLIFIRADARAWGVSHQQRPLVEASRRAKLDPAATFHILRHTYASLLAMRGVPMGVIAAQLGHTDTRMTERHYAHLAPSYVSDTVRAALPAYGLLEEPTIVPLHG
ncbi:tyrosine-type recombinase/integrase [Methylobacterium nigriterrae]|uniref:tyrosine-type recombinase/integrase n=1 Tax=Methylobacterium nigriterrae TaxID=3127512 RepID=UPI0030138679